MVSLKSSSSVKFEIKDFFEFRVCRGVIEVFKVLREHLMFHDFVHFFVQIRIFFYKISIQNYIFATNETILK